MTAKGLKNIAQQNSFEHFDKAVRESFVLGEFTLSSGITTNYYFDFLKMKDFAPQIYRMMKPQYIPVGILTGGGLISETSGKWGGLVDVKRGIFYPPKNDNSLEVTLIDDVYTTGSSLLMAERIINNAGYQVKERKVLLWRQEPRIVKEMINRKIGYIPFEGVYSLVSSVESKDGGMPKYEHKRS